MQHLLTIDVEQSHRGIPGSDSTATDPDSLYAAMRELLEFLGSTSTHVTFFVLADDLQNLRGVLAEAARNGHEIGCHGLHHARIDQLPAREFAHQVQEARKRLQDATGTACTGFRAPWFSRPENPAAFWEALLQAGFEYDASGRLLLDSPTVESAPIRTVDVPVVRGAAFSIGVLGGLALRALPRAFLNHLLRRCTRAGRSACLYLHPYEWHRCTIPPQAGWAQQARRRFVIERTLPRLRWMLARGEWTSVARSAALRETGA